MSRIKIPIGKYNFASIRESGSYYVDKSGLIYELVNEHDNLVTLITRPRRFGKTLNMSMLEYFFDIRRDSKELFQGLTIAKQSSFCDEWMNQYPVISISFKDVEGWDFRSAFEMLKLLLSDVAKRYIFIRDSVDILEADQERFDELLYRRGTTEDIKDAVKILMRILNIYYKKKVILLIDEYDVPISKAQENGYYEEMLDLIRGILSLSLKSNEYLKFAVITGCLKISKESIFTGANNFAAYSVMDNDFSEYFGFTEKEVDTLLEATEKTEKATILKEWYDGYLFGKTEVYCPWDVVNYVAALLTSSDAKPKNYWKNTSHNGIIRTFVDRTELAVHGKFEILLNGGTIRTAITDDLTYDFLHSSEQNLWSVLYMTGYLTEAGQYDQDGEIALKIPNKEIESIFKDTVIAWFQDTMDSEKQRKMFQALWSGDAKTASKLISEFLWNTISYHDYREDFYHGFLAGIFQGMGYAVESNREHGLGRPDLVVLDRRMKKALLVEVKRANIKQEMEVSCQEALVQIRENQYDADYRNEYEVVCYGMAFYKKEVMVEVMR